MKSLKIEIFQDAYFGITGLSGLTQGIKANIFKGTPFLEGFQLRLRGQLNLLF